MIRSDRLAVWLLTGALAGLVGGVVLALAMLQLGMMASMALIVTARESLGVGLLVHFALSAVFGVLFAALVRNQARRNDALVFWGLAYGAVVWFLDPLTLYPLTTGKPVTWSLAAAQSSFGLLLGFLLYGATTGLALLILSRPVLRRPSLTGMGLGAAAGLAAAAIAAGLLNDQGQTPMFAALPSDTAGPLAWLAALVIGAVAGAVFAALAQRPSDSSGAGLVRGAMYGFLLWVVLRLTILPLILDGNLPWSVVAAADTYPALLAYLVFGGFLGLGYQWLRGFWRVLFDEVDGADDEEGVGARGLRALGHGIAAGVVGGLLFTYVMLQVGALRGVAGLMGGESEIAGLVIHLVIAMIFGAAYGLLFRRQSYDVGSAVGWGVSYGFFLWILGPQILMPMLLGVTPAWSAAGAASLTASLVGHLAYGAGLGLTYHWFETRHNPWWIARRQADEARLQRRREALQSAAPALWALVLLVGLTLPVILGAPA